MARLFVFDGDCAFCSSAMRLLVAMTKSRTPHSPFQWLDLEQLGIRPEAAQSAVQYQRDGEILQGARAIAQYLIDSKTIWASAGWLMRAPVILSFAELIYDLVAKNRHRLPGGTPECKLPRP